VATGCVLTLIKFATWLTSVVMALMSKTVQIASNARLARISWRSTKFAMELLIAWTRLTNAMKIATK